MRKYFLTITAVFSLLFVNSLLFADTIKLENGKVSAVVVSAKSAKVTRVIPLPDTSLKAGLIKVIIENISGSADVDSLQIGFFGSLMAAVEEIEKESYFPVDPLEIDDSIKKNSSEIKDIESKLTALMVKQDVFSNISFVLGNDINAETLKKQLDTVSSELSAVLQEKEELLRKLQEAKKNKETLAAARRQFVLDNKRYKLFVTIRIDEAGKEPSGLNIVYNDNNAGFFMEYDLGALPESKEIEIITKACVWQSTFEEWNDINLSVVASLDKTIWRGIINEQTDLPSSKEVKKYALNSTVFPADFFYSVDLSNDKAVKFVAEFQNTTDMPYINGKTDVFYSGAYKGVCIMPEVLPQSFARLPIDNANGILVSHRLISEEFQEEGILNIERQTVKSFEIFFNDVSREYAYDRLEISLQAGGSNIEMQDFSVSPFKLNKLSGEVVWHLDLSEENKIIKYKTINRMHNCKK